MIESLLSVVGQRGVDALAFLLAFALTALMDSVFHDKLPHDHGREFAVNGALSKGKARGSGLIFVLCIALVSLVSGIPAVQGGIRHLHHPAHCIHAVRLL